MANLSAYLDVPSFLRAPVSQETASLVGLNTTLATTALAGATSLNVGSSTGWAAAAAWILDGANSEVVTITGSVDGTHVTTTATQYAHGAGVSVSQAGASGALAESILRASAWIENYCQQGTQGGDRSLFAATRTERWSMPSTRAFIDRDNVVTVRPGHFPVSGISSLVIEFGQGQQLALDVTQLELQTEGRLIEIPYLLQSGVGIGQQLFLDTIGLSRSRRQWATLTYVGGFSSVPYDVQQACVFVTSELLAQRQNPTGASEYVMGKHNVIQRQRGDLVGDSLMLLRARDLLQPYRSEVWA